MKSERKKTLSALPLICLLSLGMYSCGPRPLRPDQVERNRLFAELLDRQDHRTLGSDGFFQKHLQDAAQPRVQEWCALALGRIGDPRALPWLSESLSAKYASVRAASAFAIGEIEDRDLLRSEGRKADAGAIAAVRALLNDAAFDVAMRAAEALGKIGDESDSLRICRRIESIFPGESAPARRTGLNLAIAALMRLKNLDACPTLEKLAGLPDPEIQWRVANALYRMRAKNSRAVLERLLQSHSDDVRAHAARALGMCEDPALAAALEPLIRPAQDGVKLPLSLRVSALQALVSLKNTRSAAAIQDALLSYPIGDAVPDQLDQLNFAVQAVAALGNIGSEANAATLQRMIQHTGPVANSAVIALAKIKRQDPEGFFSLVGASRFDSPAGERSWAAALGELGGTRARNELRGMLLRAAEDPPDGSHHLAVPAILRALARAQEPGLQEMVSTYLSSGDNVIRRTAASLYKAPANAAAPWDPIVRALSGLSGTDPESRVAILNALEPWVNAPEVQSALRSILADPERNARIAAARLLRQAGAADIPENPGASQTNVSGFTYALLAGERQDRTLAIVETTRGTFEIELFREDAPLTAANFIALARSSFFNQRAFMRVVPFFVVQGDDPRDDQEGGPGYAIRCEINMRPYEYGSVGMALSGKDTGGSQFFITLAPQPHLDGGYTCFGRVISGMQAVGHMIPGDRITRVSIVEDVSMLDYRNY